VDGLLQQLYVEAGVPDGPVAIIALGGYGRVI
jgi:UTP:GlnB (protein PII) uridylyltransferase